jgi:RNA polymerase sigma factor (sigma-70 family)
MSTDGSLTRWAHELHSSEAARREEAARQLWLHFAERLRALVRRNLDPRIRRRTDEDDILQSLFAGYVTAKPGPDGPPRSRAEVWRLLVQITLCKVANTADRHRARRRDVRREQPLDGVVDRSARTEPEDPRGMGPEDEAVARDEFARLLTVLPEDLQQILALRLEGYTNAEIATRLGRVERTIELKMRALRALLAPHLGNMTNSSL